MEPFDPHRLPADWTPEDVPPSSSLAGRFRGSGMADRLLADRAQELPDGYAEAGAQWHAAGEEETWDQTTGDGLM